MVGLGGPDHLFTVTKDNFHLPAPSQLFGELNVIAGTVTREILNKKDRFHVLEPNVVRFSFLGGLRGENAEGLSECREIVDKPFYSSIVHKRHDDFVGLNSGSWRLRGQ